MRLTSESLQSSHLLKDEGKARHPQRKPRLSWSSSAYRYGKCLQQIHHRNSTSNSEFIHMQIKPFPDSGVLAIIYKDLEMLINILVQCTHESAQQLTRRNTALEKLKSVNCTIFLLMLRKLLGQCQNNFQCITMRRDPCKQVGIIWRGLDSVVQQCSVSLKHNRSPYCAAVSSIWLNSLSRCQAIFKVNKTQYFLLLTIVHPLSSG